MSESACPHCGETIAADSEACPACGHLHASAPCETHEDRTADGVCVICGRAVCEECNRPQARHFVCEQHAEIPLISGWAQVYSAADDVDAELVRENLNAEGIESRVLSQRDHYTFAVDIGELNQVRVLVPAFEYDVANDLLTEHRITDGEIVFACPNCGEAFEPGTATCPSCGAALPAHA